MANQNLNRRFLLLQALLILIDCIGAAYISPILVSLGYSELRIGRVLAMGALASAAARPLWGLLNDRFACARQVTLLGTAAGAGCYALLTCSQGHPLWTVTAVMGLYVTVICMMNFVDTWALRLIDAGFILNYGLTRAGGSFSYAVGAMVFGAVVARWGFRPGIPALAAVWLLLCAVSFTIPNPPPPVRSAPKVTLRRGLAALAPNRVYWVMLAALFLCTFATCAMESFYSVLILSLGGTERHVGVAMFLQAMSELPVMIGYTRLRDRLKLSPAVLICASMLCYALKALILGCTGSLPVVLAAALLQSLSFALFTPACVDFMLETVPGAYLSTAHLLFLAIGQGAASVLGNFLSGLLAEQFGISRMFRLVSLLALAAGVLAWHSAKLLKRRQTA